MGPRSDERGNLGVREAESTFIVTLQWGRAQMSAEIPWLNSQYTSTFVNCFNGAALR